MVGSWVADRLLGSERTLFYSAALIMLGHISLAVLPGLVGLGIGLACVAIGSGGLKANATAIVGTLYAPDDERRDGGFTIFYMGINLGAFVGQMLTGLVWGNENDHRFHLAFGLAAVGMAFGLIQYSLGRKNLRTRRARSPNPLPASNRRLVVGGVVVVLALIVVLLLSGIVTAENLADVVIWTVADHLGHLLRGDPRPAASSAATSAAGSTRSSRCSSPAPRSSRSTSRFHGA